MFTEESKKYYAKNIRVVPVVGKHCFEKDWANTDFEERAQMYPMSGVGLSMGDVDLVVLDLDSLKDQEKKELEEFLKDYPTPIQRRGNPNKLPSRFYSKTWQKTKEKFGTIEMLAAEKGQASVCVLPPSKHHLGGCFEWVGKPLYDFDLSLLPPLPRGAWDGLKKITEKYQEKEKSQITKSDGTRCNHGSYDLLSKIMVGHVKDGEAIDYIVDLLLEKDEEINQGISFFECPSRKEWKTKDKRKNCEAFVLECYEKKTKSGQIQRVEIGKPEQSTYEEASKNYKKLPRLKGFGAVLFNELYKKSPIPRSQLCFMNTVNLLSLMIGNKLHHRGTACNLYQYGIAPSGYGKDFSFKRSMQILNESGLSDLIGTSSPTSESVILTMLEKQREQCLFVNEAEIILKRITNDRMNFGLRECLTDIYDYGGKEHAAKIVMGGGKKKDIEKIGHVFSPFVNINMTSTTEAFSKYASEDIFNTGFGSRFLFYFEDRHKSQKFIEDYNPPIDKNVVTGCILLAKSGSDYVNLEDPSEHFLINKAMVSECGNKAYREIFEDIEKEKKRMEGSKFYSLICRKLLFVNKFVTIHHVCINPAEFVDVPIKEDSYIWAKEAVDAIIHNMIQNLEENVSNTHYGQLSNSFLRYIRKRTIAKEGTDKRRLSANFRGIDASVRAKVVSDLIDQGAIFLKDKLLYASKKKD